MPAEKITGKVLFVDDEETMRDLLSRHARFSDIEDFEVLEDANSAITRLRELEETASAIFSDGLNGGWRDVIAAAKEARVPAVVLSGDPRLQEEVEEAGAFFLNKERAKLGFIEATLAELHRPIET